MTNLALKSSTGEIQAARRELDREQLDLLKRTLAQDLTNDEFALFTQVAQRLNLDPFAKQIYAIKRKSKNGPDKVTFQTGIDGYRLIADRTGLYQGQTDAQWCGADGVWRDVWLSPSEPPAAARIGIYRKGFVAPCYAVARWDAYAQKNFDGAPNNMWSKLGDVMLAKCAEALALRKAFPGVFDGVYTTEEMGQADEPPRRITPANTVEIIDPETGEIMTPAQVRAASRAENNRQDEEFAPLAEKLIGDLQNLASAKQLESHVQHNWGHARLYPRSKAASRYWSALQRAAERFAVPASKLREWCESAPGVVESTIEPDHGDAYEGPDAKVNHG